jgi:hypothetical protein
MSRTDDVEFCGAGRAVTSIAQQRDDAANVIHNANPPALTSDQNNLVWTYQVSGLSSEINSFQVGPVSPNVTVSSIAVDVPGWTGTRAGEFITWTGPTNVPEGQVAVATFQTSADVKTGTGILKAIIFVDVLPAKRGARPKTAPTFIPQAN